jgi:plastocyanin
MHMKSIAIAIVLGMTAGCVTAFAAEHAISQKGGVFSQTQIALKKGDRVIFVNDDNVTHNIFSTSPGNAFNIGVQAPGASTPIKFASAGDVVILCAIHPRMKMAVKVTD